MYATLQCEYELLTSIMISFTVTFYSHTLYLLCLSFIISVIVINMSRNRKYSPLPASLKAIFLDGFIGKVFGSSQSNAIVIESQSEELKEAPFEENGQSDDHHMIQMRSNTSSKAHLIQNEWIRLARVIDRIAFVIYVIIFILMGFIHFI